jgi:hypothetical protein
MNSTNVLFTLAWHLLLRHACTFTFLQVEGTFYTILRPKIIISQGK